MKNKWYTLGCVVLSLLATQTTSAGNNLFGALSDAVDAATRSSRNSTPPPRNSSTQLGKATIGEGQIFYDGYSKEFQSIKQLISDDKIEQAKQAQKKKGTKNLLDSLELGTIALDGSDNSTSITAFTNAENILGKRKDTTQVGDFFSGAGNFVAGVFSGDEETGDYLGAGFERILLLNYKSIAFMLEGERKAYNVTRRAIDQQNIEKKKFDALMRSAKKELAKEKKEQSSKGVDIDKMGLDSIVRKQYKASERKAKSVPSAFVNPFGFYMAGVVQEFDAYEDKSLRDNARISYKKALGLNPKSKVIKQAFKAMKKPAPKNRRLVHVVVADGFAPEKKVSRFELYFGSLPTIIKLPLSEAVASRVDRIEVQTTKGKRLAKLSLVADITALALRYQMDAEPLQQLRMTTSIIRNVVETQAWNQAAQSAGVFSSLISSVKQSRDEMANPDMRSWMTLPSRLLAARIYVSKGTRQIKLVAYDKKRRVLSSQVINLDKDSHNFVYARTLDEVLYTSTSKKMWVGLR